ncbi:unnamed protein product [Polarella glacialis]|uniref:Uncharacterized protein n=1 Tax=Polarella glacialis TaxID=89957 RepID=A0A813G7C5_POLGL|nr:unnamed protein product [Polarella glacialis]
MLWVAVFSPRPLLLIRLQARWLRKVLAVDRAPRCVLMRELGIQSRLSTQAWEAALALHDRVMEDPRLAAEREVLEVAAREDGTWTSAVRAKEWELGLQRSGAAAGDPKQAILKARLRRHRAQAIREALQADEDRRWRQQAAQQSHWQRFSLTAWTVAGLSHSVDSVEALQAYARLKLGHWVGLGEPCCLCGAVEGQTTSHLVQRCTALRAERQVFGDMVASEGLPAGPGQLDVHATGETDSVPGVLAGICLASAVATVMRKKTGKN